MGREFHRTTRQRDHLQQHPIQIQGLTGVTAITATYYGAYALLNDGTVRAWGSNFVGQLGNGTTGIGSSAPAQVTGLTGVAAVTASDFSAYALLSDGTVRAWGDNSSGQLGSGTSANSSNRPVQVQGLSGVTSTVASNYNAYALLADRTVRSWGANGSGQLGNGTTSESYTPVRVQGISNVTSMAAGKGSVYAVLGDGTARAWGLNQSGQLGTGTTTNSTTAIQLSGLTTALSITAGKGDTNNPVAYAVLRDGTVRAWGVNPTGQLGNGSTANSNVPTQVTGLTGLAGTASISAARGTAFAVLADGTIRAWGDNYNHQLGVTGTTSFSNVPLGVTGLSGSPWEPKVPAPSTPRWSTEQRGPGAETVLASSETALRAIAACPSKSADSPESYPSPPAEARPTPCWAMEQYGHGETIPPASSVMQPPATAASPSRSRGSPGPAPSQPAGLRLRGSD
ncbi:RCC1 and BTB domain-containing protein 1 [Arthrobacter sp. Hiyo8]|nr:RCC1 and BTB domain-containing protein 1 [Arthrobacter sp. Hiyo8]